MILWEGKKFYKQIYEHVIYFLYIYRKEGYIYDKEAVLNYILQKKKEIARKLKEYEKQKNKAKVC